MSLTERSNFESHFEDHTFQQAPTSSSPSSKYPPEFCTHFSWHVVRNSDVLTSAHEF